MKFTIGDRVVRRIPTQLTFRHSGNIYRGTDEFIPFSSGGKVIGFSEGTDPWVQIEGEYYVDGYGQQKINYYNPQFLIKIGGESLIKEYIKDYKFLDTVK